MTPADTPRTVPRGAREVASGFTLPRLAAVAGPLGVVIFFVATALHPGHQPGNLEAVLPQYAADHHWLAIHLSQLAGISLAAVLLVALATRLTEQGGRGGTPARLGLVATGVTLAIYAVNQAIDGVGIKFVANDYLSASPADRPAALALADAIRHLELGTTSVFELALGVTLVLLGLAACWTAGSPTWLGVLAIAAGIGWSVLGVLLASQGFDVSVSTPAMAVTYLTGIWVMAQAVPLWRRTGRRSDRRSGPPPR